MTRAIRRDVAVIGGGPAGSATAIRLAELGFTVALVERDTFPRAHVGICIGDASVALFDYLGVGDQFHQLQSWQRRQTAIAWGGKAEWVQQRGFHVNRGAVDLLLLQRARAAGVIVFQPANILAIQEADPAGWYLKLSVDGAALDIASRFVVDATGRRGTLGGRRTRDTPPLLALHATWSLTGTPAFDGMIAACNGAWLWYAQTAHDQAVVSVFTDPRCSITKASPRNHYLRVILRSCALGLGHLDRFVGEPAACDATSRHVAAPIGEYYLCVGDACMTVDPLSSQGVHLALQSGLQAAVVINTILTKPSNASIARHFYRERVAARVQLYTDRARNEYAKVAATISEPFWLERSSGLLTAQPAAGEALTQPPAPTQRIRLAESVCTDKAPVIAGDLVVLQNVLRHRGTNHSIAFVDGAAIADMLAHMPAGTTMSDIPSLWSAWVDPLRAKKIAEWLWARRILVAAQPLPH